MTSPWRLLYVQPVGEKGGMETDLVNEVQNIDRSRFTPIVACLEDGPILEDLKSLGLRVHLVKRGRLRNVTRALLTVTRLTNLIRRENVDLVISQNSYAHLYGRLAALLTSKPIVLRSGGVSYPLDWVDWVAYRLTASAVIANSRFSEQALTAAGVPPGLIRVIHYGVPVERFAIDDSPVREELGLSENSSVVTTVGRLQRWKGQHIVLAAAARVVGRFPEARFLIVGDALFGIERDYPIQLRTLTAKLGLEGRVFMLGHRTDIPRILAASDVVLVPSINPEPFGLVVIEAMAAGKPVIASSAGGPAEILTDGDTGFLIPPNDPDSLAEAIVRVLEDPDLRRRTGTRARQVAGERFRLARAVREYETIYDDCLRQIASR